MRATDDGPCNILVFLQPIAPNEEDATLVGMIAETTEGVAGDIDKIEDFLPDTWGGTFKTRLYPIEQVIADMCTHPDEFAIASDAAAKYAEEGITHLALLEDPVAAESGEFFFTKGVGIKNVSMLVAYCAERNCYRLLHCEGCAVTYQSLIAFMQPEWDNAVSGAIQTAGETIN